jgi:hypothetical protein
MKSTLTFYYLTQKVFAITVTILMQLISATSARETLTNAKSASILTGCSQACATTLCMRNVQTSLSAL